MKLENDQYCFQCTTKAAEITSFFDKKNEIEYIWSGDSKYWSGRNPILFPIIGSSYNKKYWFDGTEYQMGNHGFARQSEFEFVNQTDDTITLKLQSNETTKSQYPFDFTLFVTYQLINDTILVAYRIINESKNEMPFTFGLHPAFNCPLEKDKAFSDYYLEFASASNLVGNNPEQGKGITKRLKLGYQLFTDYHTLTFDNLSSPYLSVTDGKHGVQISTVGYNKVAVWTPQAPFICLEPWHIENSNIAYDKPFIERDATYVLSAGQSFLTTYTIKVF